MKIYLYLNAALYLGFAVWCTVASRTTSASLGYVGLSAGGRSEYLAIYGGLQLGLAAMFYLCARDQAFLKLGMMIAVGLYAPIVVYRAITVARFWPVSTLTVMTGVLEAVLLISALVILKMR
jgi:hypothetical protein